MAKKKLGFNGLARRVTREYERDGVSPKTARAWGRATAGKVAVEKGAVGHHHKKGCHCGFCRQTDADRRRHLQEARKKR